mgnify:CR=1 FL=1
MNLLKQVIIDQSQTYAWLEILQCFWEFYRYRRPLTDEEIVVFEQVANFHGIVNLTHMFDGPHRAAPDTMMREMASEILQKNQELYRGSTQANNTEGQKQDSLCWND